MCDGGAELGGPWVCSGVAVDQEPPADDAVVVFQAHRGMLLGLAYRLLGSFADAEDVVQMAWLRWSATDRSVVEAPGRFLVTVVTRLSIDVTRLAHRQRETYVGPWLPEPVRAEDMRTLEPADTVAQRETLSLAMLRIMQQLSAPERAVYVLREAFDLPYREIGEILGLSDANARQLHRRGSLHLDSGQDRFVADPEIHRHLVEQFLLAARTGERNTLEGLLARDVTLWADGGGRVSAALRPVTGADRVARLLIGVFSLQQPIELRIVEVNGREGLLILRDSQVQICTLEISDSLITGIQWMSNPDKLTRVRWRS
jgi:RNA polymerase sigma-70 factor (ECF subfamily)